MAAIMHGRGTLPARPAPFSGTQVLKLMHRQCHCSFRRVLLQKHVTAPAVKIGDVALVEDGNSGSWENNTLSWDTDRRVERVKAPENPRPIIICPGFGNCSLVRGGR